jgi:hypothetical protein
VHTDNINHVGAATSLESWVKQYGRHCASRHYVLNKISIFLHGRLMQRRVVATISCAHRRLNRHGITLMRTVFGNQRAVLSGHIASAGVSVSRAGCCAGSIATRSIASCLLTLPAFVRSMLHRPVLRRFARTAICHQVVGNRAIRVPSVIRAIRVPSLIRAIRVPSLIHVIRVPSVIRVPRELIRVTEFVNQRSVLAQPRVPSPRKPLTGRGHRPCPSLGWISATSCVPLS